ncbi:MAG: hypothetical protein HKL88_03265 [Bacteroidia bacterium]|nr:hypothetical protein [Bacteroidia bacterium]
MSSAFNILFIKRIFRRKVLIFLPNAVILPLMWLAIIFAGAARGQSVREQTFAKLNAFFSKDAAVKNYVRLTGDSLYLYSHAQIRDKSDSPEFALSWSDAGYLSGMIDTMTEGELKSMLRELRKRHSRTSGDSNPAQHTFHSGGKPQSEDMPLAGLRVAIDPGHIGGTYAMGNTESRCMTLQCHANGKCDTFRLIEGNLTFFTALLLKKKLELKGALVMLTRNDTALSSLDITFGEWKRRIRRAAYADSLVKAGLLSPKELRLLRLRLGDKVLFAKVFGSVDMAERAKKMNRFHPDLSVIIHYNVNERNIGWRQTTPKDFVMAFVGGCVVSKDLETEAGRLNFLRLLISPGIENSISLSSKVIHHLSADLGVPIATKEDATYLAKNCLPTTAEGVYSRDLALTRLTHGTLVYGEALYQDNDKECRLLTANDGNFEGFVYPKRIEIVAEAYYKGILEYLSTLRNK